MSYQEKHTIYITEPGLYSLIFKSQKDEAEDFKDWVFDDVLPKIRKPDNIQQRYLYIINYRL